MTRSEMAATILAGLVSNPSIIQPCDRAGWNLVNCTNEQLAQFAIELADAVRAADLPPFKDSSND
jgi:hypothetical protein